MPPFRAPQREFRCLRDAAPIFAALLTVTASPTFAAEAENIPELRPSLLDDFDLALGVSATSDYIFRGITQTDHEPALQGYVEASVGVLYAGAWASNVEFAGSSGVETDLSIGLRPTIEDLAIDFGYVHYVYSDDLAPDFGELYAKAEYTVSDLTVGTSGFFSPDYLKLGGTAFYLEGTGSYALPHNFTLSGAIGYQSFEETLGLHDYLTWNAGASWTWNDRVTLDLRYHDSDLGESECTENSGVADGCDARVVARVSVDTSLKQLLTAEAEAAR